MRLELTRVGLLVELANHYITRGALVPTPTNTYRDTYRHTHAHTYSHTHRYTHARTHTYSYAYTQIYTHIHPRAHPHTRMHTHIQRYTLVRIHTETRLHTRTHIRPSSSSSCHAISVDISDPLSPPLPIVDRFTPYLHRVAVCRFKLVA